MNKIKTLRKTGFKTMSEPHSLTRLRFNEKELSEIANSCKADKEGLVQKKGPSKGQGYKPRWLKLKGNLLFYFKLLESGELDTNGPVGLLILESCCPERAHKDDRPFAFTISFTNDKSRVYMFSAHSIQEADSWVEALRNASYEQLRMRVYQLQKEISTRTGMDPLIGLASKVKRQKSTLMRSTRGTKGHSVVRVFRPMDTHRPLFNFSSLDAPLFEIHLSCSGLPLLPGGSHPSTYIRSSLSLGPGDTTKALCDTEIVEHCRDPMFFSVVMLEVTREATRSGVVRFAVETVGMPSLNGETLTQSEEVDTCKIVSSDDDDVCHLELLAAGIGQAEVSLETLLDYPATGDCGRVQVELISNEGVPAGTLTAQIRKAKEVMQYCDRNLRARRSTIVKKADTIQGLQLPVKNIHFCPFQFPTSQSSTLKVLEEMSESVFNLQVPLQLVKCYIKEDLCRIRSIEALGQFGTDWSGAMNGFKTLLQDSVTSYQLCIDSMNTALLEDECTFKLSTDRKKPELQFVPCNLHIQVLRVATLRSTDRAPSDVVSVGQSSDLASGNQTAEPSRGCGQQMATPPDKETCYTTVTFGAAADHVRGFKHGGLKTLLKSARNQPSFITGCHQYGELSSHLNKIRDNIHDYKNYLLRAAANQNAEDMSDAMQGISNGVQLMLQLLQNPVVVDAIQALRSARMAYLKSSDTPPDHTSFHCHCKFTSLNDWVWNGKRFIRVSTQWKATTSTDCVNTFLVKLLEKVERASRLIIELRHEAHASSINQLPVRYKPTYCWSYDLLNVLRRLDQTLQGMYTVVDSSLCFATLRSDTSVEAVKELRARRDSTFSQILTALMTGFYQSLSEHLTDQQFFIQIRKLGYLAHFQSFLSDQGDEAGMLEDMHMAVLELGNVSFQILPSAEVESGTVDFSIYGSRMSLVVRLLFPRPLLSLVPDQEVASGQLISVVPVVFTQGINERQTFANLASFGSVTEEDVVNSNSLAKLDAYINSYSSLILGESSDEALLLKEKFANLQKSHSKTKSKNVEFMMEAEMLCRSMRGGRFTSCKSAKDRTGMAVTLEEVSLLAHHHGLDPTSTVTALNALRSQGTRLYNCYKNTGRYRYAFHTLTSRLFPPLYQPPPHTCSNSPD